MSDRTQIEWTDATWNPLRGCSAVSPGCAHCYAAGVAARFAGPGQPYEGLARFDEAGKPHWTGEIRLVEKVLSQPLRWKRPRRIFVNSMSDLFHEAVSNEFIAKVFGLMALASQHTFQILTKRAKRMRDWFQWAERQWANCYPGEPANALLQFLGDQDIGQQVSRDDFAAPWPLSNVWLGVSCEDQQRADERIPHLIATPAAVRFISAEPLLGLIDMRRFLHHGHCPEHPSEGTKAASFGCAGCSDRLHWVIAGGESGRFARHNEPKWFQQIRDQCLYARVPFFFNQWGGKRAAGRLLDGREWSEFPRSRMGLTTG